MRPVTKGLTVAADCDDFIGGGAGNREQFQDCIDKLLTHDLRADIAAMDDELDRLRRGVSKKAPSNPYVNLA